MSDDKKMSIYDNRQIQTACRSFLAFNDRLLMIEDINVRNAVFLHTILTGFDVLRGMAQTCSSQCDHETQESITKSLSVLNERLCELVRNRPSNVSR